MINKFIRKVRIYYKRTKNNLKKKIVFLIAKSLNKWEWTKYYMNLYYHRYKIIITCVVLILLINGFIYNFYDNINNYIDNSILVENFGSMFLTLGGSFIGISAISFSLVMFAMQINVERLPHGLFWSLSSDVIIMLTFLIIFFLSISICFLPLFITSNNILLMLSILSTSITIILSLIFYSYRRALLIINPIKQLTKIADDAKLYAKVYKRRPKIGKNFIVKGKKIKKDEFSTSHDIDLIVYFSLYPNWHNDFKMLVDYCIAFSKRYARSEDYLVSRNALDVIFEINRNYIDVKGKTFFNDILLFSINNPCATDNFINYTLENMRMLLSNTISSKNEVYIEQILISINNLVKLYLTIDYSNKNNHQKKHATLAATYLQCGVVLVSKQNLVDATMNGLRLMKEAAVDILLISSPEDSLFLTNVIRDVSISALVQKDVNPIVITGIEQLSIVLRNGIIYQQKMRLDYFFDVIEKDIDQITTIVLFLKDNPFTNIHKTILASYYSFTDDDSFIMFLAKLVEEITKQTEPSDMSNKIINNIYSWSKELFVGKKEIFKIALKVKSSSLFEITRWVSQVSKILISLSKSINCDKYMSYELEQKALDLSRIFLWIEKDKESISALEHYNFTDTIFDLAIYSKFIGCMYFYKEFRKILISWMLNTSNVKSGFDILENCIYGIVGLDASDETTDNFEEFKIILAEKLQVQDEGFLEHMVENIRIGREYKESSYKNRSIRNIIHFQDMKTIEGMLNEVVDILEERLKR